jgi:hypothetical protein
VLVILLNKKTRVKTVCRYQISVFLKELFMYQKIDIIMHRSLTSEQDANWSEVGLYFTLWMGAVWLYLSSP